MFKTVFVSQESSFCVLGSYLTHWVKRALFKLDLKWIELSFIELILVFYIDIVLQIQKTIKKTARREQLMREEAEQKRLKTVLELQYVLDKLGDDEVRTDLKQGLNGVPILSEEELSLLDEFYKLVDPERDMSLRY